MSGRTIAMLFVVLAPFGSPGATALADQPTFRWEAVSGKSLTLLGPQGVVWRFNYGADQPKPYFHPVSLLSGETLSWNEPPDHAWHHALWFSWHTIDGVNYWEHDAATGLPVGRTSWVTPKISSDENGAARIELRLEYAPVGSPPILRETRIVSVTAPDESGRYHFDWDATFAATIRDAVLQCVPIPPDPDGKPWGGYAGLSLRLAKDLTDRRLGTEFGPATFDQAGVYRSRGLACDYQGSVGGRSAGIAMFSHPGNPRNPTPWYAIGSNMSYLNPAFLQDEPYTVAAGRSLRLRYRISVHTGLWDAKRLAAELAQYQD